MEEFPLSISSELKNETKISNGSSSTLIFIKDEKTQQRRASLQISKFDVPLFFATSERLQSSSESAQMQRFMRYNNLKKEKIIQTNR